MTRMCLTAHEFMEMRRSSERLVQAAEEHVTLKQRSDRMTRSRGPLSNSLHAELQKLAMQASMIMEMVLWNL